eukprot:scaffold101015_cov71-Phaeocystis_antarctica.AAC.12
MPDDSMSTCARARASGWVGRRPAALGGGAADGARDAREAVGCGAVRVLSQGGARGRSGSRTRATRVT